MAHHSAGRHLLRSYRPDEWPRWFALANAPAPRIRGAVFDSSLTMPRRRPPVPASRFFPSPYFTRELATEALVRPFEATIHARRY